MQQRTRDMRPRLGRGIAILIVALSLSACGSGSNLPTSFPESAHGSLPGSLPTRPETTTAPPTTTTPPPTTTTPPPTTTETPPTSGAIQAGNATSGGSGSSDETPWGWIAVIAVFLLAAAGIAGWAIARRRSGRQSWPDAVARARGASGAFQDLVLNTLIASQTLNHQAAWTDAASKGQMIAADLQRLGQEAPSDLDRQRVGAASQALNALMSAINIAASAADGVPLDDASARVVRDRLDAFAGAVSALPAPLRADEGY